MRKMVKLPTQLLFLFFAGSLAFLPNTLLGETLNNQPYIDYENDPFDTPHQLAVTPEAHAVANSAPSIPQNVAWQEPVTENIAASKDIAFTTKQTTVLPNTVIQEPQNESILLHVSSAPPWIFEAVAYKEYGRDQGKKRVQSPTTLTSPIPQKPWTFKQQPEGKILNRSDLDLVQVFGIQVPQQTASKKTVSTATEITPPSAELNIENTPPLLHFQPQPISQQSDPNIVSLIEGPNQAPFSQGTVSENALTLQQAYELALLHHPMIDEALATREEAEGNFTVSKSTYFPRIDLQADVGPSTDLKTGDTEYGNGSLSMRQTLYDFGGQENSVESARLRRDSSDMRYNRIREDIAALTINSYLSILQSQEMVYTYENARLFYQKLLDTFWERYNAGISSRADAKKVEVSLRGAEAQLVVQREQLSTAKTLLANIIQQPVADVAPHNGLLSITIIEEIEEALAIAYENNLKLKAEEFEIEAQKSAIIAREAEYYPSLGYKLSVENDTGDFDDPETTFDAQLTLTWNLFNGHATEGRIRVEQAALRRLRAQKKNSELQIQNILTDAFNSYKASAEEFALAEQAYNSSVSLMSLYLSEFDLGIRTLLDLITAREGQTSAATREINARFVRVRAILNIILEEGRLAKALDCEDTVEVNGFPSINLCEVSP